MADFLSGLTIVSGISRFIPAFLVLFIVYAILAFTKALGDNKFVQAIVSFCVAALFLISSKASGMIAFMTPWFVILFIFIIFVIIAFKSMGVSDGQIMNAMSSYRSIAIWVIALSVIIGLLSLANSYGQGLLNQQPGYEDYTQNPDGTFTSPDGTIVQSPPGVATNNFTTNLTRTLFHPEILGFAIIGLIGTFSIYFMTKPPAL